MTSDENTRRPLRSCDPAFFCYAVPSTSRNVIVCGVLNNEFSGMSQLESYWSIPCIAERSVFKRVKARLSKFRDAFVIVPESQPGQEQGMANGDASSSRQTNTLSKSSFISEMELGGMQQMLNKQIRFASNDTFRKLSKNTATIK